MSDKTIVKTSHGAFIKINDGDSTMKHPCLECKTICSGYWHVNKHGIRRPYPFCQSCLENGLGIQKKK